MIAVTAWKTKHDETEAGDRVELDSTQDVALAIWSLLNKGYVQIIVEAPS